MLSYRKTLYLKWYKELWRIIPNKCYNDYLKSYSDIYITFLELGRYNMKLYQSSSARLIFKMVANFVG